MIAGDLHGTPGSAALALTLLHDLRAGGGAKKLLLEYDAPSTRAFFPDNDPIGRTFARRLRHDRPIQYATDDPLQVNDNNIGLYAKHLGFDVSGHDALGFGAPSVDHREAAMVTSVLHAVLDAQSTIVMVGSNHVAELHEKLAPQFNTLSIATMDVVEPGDTHQTKRFSYLLSTPEILTINPGPALLDGPPLDAVNFINHVLP